MVRWWEGEGERVRGWEGERAWRSTSLIHYPRIDASPKSTTGLEERTVREESRRG